MSFQFGSAVALDPYNSLSALLCVVGFLVFFDYFTRILDYFVEKAQLYQQMLHSIYREIMLMGLLAFAIIVYKAAVSNNDPGDDTYDDQVFSSLDFGMMLCFCIILFSVLHTFYFIVLSVSNEYRFHRYNTEDILELTSKIEFLLKVTHWKRLFESSYWPFSYLKRRVEFYLLKDLFQELYLLPNNFDYGAYLSLAYSKYCSRIVERSAIGWAFVVVLIVVNYLRIVAGFECGGANDVTKDPSLQTRINCYDYSIRLFLFSGIVLLLYFGTLLFVSHYYKQRLIRIGCEKDPTEYVDYLKIKRKMNLKSQQMKTEDMLAEERYTSRELRMIIEQDIHSNEHGIDKDQAVIAIASVVMFFYQGSKYGFQLAQAAYKKLKSIVAFLVFSKPMNKSGKTRSFTKPKGSIKSNTSSKEKSLGNRRMSLSELVGGVAIVPRRDTLVRSVSASSAPSTDEPLGDSNQALIDNRVVSVKQRLSVHFIQQQKQFQQRQSLLHTNTVTPQTSTFANVHSNNTILTSGGNKEEDLRGSEIVTGNSPSPLKSMRSIIIGSDQPSLKAGQVAPVEINDTNTSGTTPQKKVLTARASTFSMYNILKTTPKQHRQVMTGQYSKLSPKKRQLSQFHDIKRNIAAVNKDLKNIFLFRKPIFFVRAAELAVLFHSIYLAIWVTAMLTIAKEAQYTKGWYIGVNLFMIIPIVWGFLSMPIINEISSLIIAISDLDLVVIYEVLKQMETTDFLIGGVRQTFLSMIDCRINQKLSPEEFVETLFLQMDSDGNGYLDQEELRHLLRRVRVTFSDYRYKLLFRTLDIRSRGFVSKEEFKRFIFTADHQPPPEVTSSNSFLAGSPRSFSFLSPTKVHAEFSPSLQSTIQLHRKNSLTRKGSNLDDIQDISNDEEKNSSEEGDNRNGNGYRLMALQRQVGDMSDRSANSSTSGLAMAGSLRKDLATSPSKEMNDNDHMEVEEREKGNRNDVMEIESLEE